jgi:hypothetical protein
MRIAFKARLLAGVRRHSIPSSADLRRDRVCTRAPSRQDDTVSLLRVRTMDRVQELMIHERDVRYGRVSVENASR